MKCYLDTNVLDWILDNPHGVELLGLMQRGEASIVLSADSVHEVYRTRQDADKWEQLRDALTDFLPVASTHLPIAGIARSGLTVVSSSSRVDDLRARLEGLGVIGLDCSHLMNASQEGCDCFVTLDGRLLRKRLKICSIVGVECLTPETLLQRMGAAGQV